MFHRLPLFTTLGSNLTPFLFGVKGKSLDFHESFLRLAQQRQVVPVAHPTHNSLRLLRRFSTADFRANPEDTVN